MEGVYRSDINGTDSGTASVAHPFVGSLDWVDVGHNYGRCCEKGRDGLSHLEMETITVSAPLYGSSLGQIDIGAIYYIVKPDEFFVSG